MTLEYLQIKYDLLATNVTRMRSYQQKYFMYRAIQDKNNMLRYQREVDKLIKEYNKERKNPQLTIL